MRCSPAWPSCRNKSVEKALRAKRLSDFHILCNAHMIMMCDDLSQWWMCPGAIQMQNKSPYSTYFSLPPVITLHAASVQTAHDGSLSAATDWPNHFEITYATTNSSLEEGKSFSWDLSEHVCDMMWICSKFKNSKHSSGQNSKIFPIDDRNLEMHLLFILPFPSNAESGHQPATCMATSHLRHRWRQKAGGSGCYVCCGNSANFENVQVMNAWEKWKK